MRKEANEKKKRLFFIFVAAAAAAAFVAIAYFTHLGGFGLLKKFQSGTTINGFEVSGLTPEQAREYFDKKAKNYEISVKAGYIATKLTREDICMEAADVSVFEAALAEQNADREKLELTADVYTCDFEAFDYAISRLADDGEHTEDDAQIADDTTTIDGAADAENTTESTTIQGTQMSAESTSPEAVTLSADTSSETETISEDTPEGVSEAARELSENIILIRENYDGHIYAATNAHLVFNKDTDSFEIAEGEEGTLPDAEAVSGAIYSAVQSLETHIDLEGSDYLDQPTLTAASDELAQALAEANTYKDLKITLTFTPDEKGEDEEETTKTLDITWDTFKSWLYADTDGTTICVNDTLLSEYVDGLVEEYSVTRNTARFKTTAGNYISVKTSSQGQTVNRDGLYEIIYNAVTTNTGGTFGAPYDAKTEEDEIVDFGGNYVEIDLTNQVLYCYKNGSLVLTSNIVTGKVTAGHATPAGVYTIKAKQRNRYLTGQGYKSWVYYWMPFNGGIGLHDATWRSKFGGSIYYRSGSHGCVNMPLSKAKELYSYVEVGEYVVLYNGTESSDTSASESTESTKTETTDTGNTSNTSSNSGSSSSGGNTSSGGSSGSSSGSGGSSSGNTGSGSGSGNNTSGGSGSGSSTGDNTGGNTSGSGESGNTGGDSGSGENTSGGGDGGGEGENTGGSTQSGENGGE